MARDASAKKPRTQGRSAAASSSMRSKAPEASAKAPASSSQPPRNLRVPRAKGSASGAGRRSLRQRLSSARDSAVALGARLKRPGSIVLKLLLGCAALAAALVLGRLLQHHLTTSPAFAIDKIEVVGLSRIERPELLASAGIDLGRNVFERNPAEVRARLLKHPWVAEAEVSRRLPGSYAIKVRERAPIALLVVEPCNDKNPQAESENGCDDGSALYLLSEDGKLFKRFDAKDPVDLPVITGIDRERFGSDPEFHKTILLEAAQLLHDYRAQGMWQKLPISEIHVEPSDAFSLYVGEALTLVRLGAAPFAQKLPKMKKVFARLEHEQAVAEYIYLDNEDRPDRVTVRLR
jgi:cell division protein FtsQ